MASATASTNRERRNWLIHLLYVRQEFAECLKVVEETLRAAGGLCEYPLFIKGLIQRQQGRISESLQYFQAACALNPRNAANLKQVGRSLFLLGRHKAALEAYAEADKYSTDDRDLYQCQGLCHMHLKQYDQAEDCFQQANSITKHESTFKQLATLRVLQGDLKGAIEVYLEALDNTPDNPDIMTAIALLQLRLGESAPAYEKLMTSLRLDPRDGRTILAAGSVLQDHNDPDQALLKYRAAAIATPNSAQLWNNVGMCFFSKGKHVAALACLKRALYLDPFEWIICFNAGLVCLHTGQYTSAFHHLSAAIALKPDFASGYGYLGVALARMGDLENSIAAYERSIALEKDYTIFLNYAISLANGDRLSEASAQLEKFETLWAMVPPAAQQADKDLLDMRAHLRGLLGLLPTDLLYPGSPKTSHA